MNLHRFYSEMVNLSKLCNYVSRFMHSVLDNQKSFSALAFRVSMKYYFNDNYMMNCILIDHFSLDVLGWSIS